MKIKRPLFIISMSILVVIYAINTMPGSTVLYSLALFALFIILHWKTSNKYTYALILSGISVAAGILFFHFYNENLYNKIHIYTDMDKLEITGNITGCSDTSGQPYIVIDVDTINGKKINNISAISYTNDILQPGISIKASGKLKNFTPTGNYLYNYSKGIFVNFVIENQEINTDNKSIAGFFYDIKEKLIDISRKIYHYKNVPMAVAMGLGDKSLLSDYTVKLFTFIGLSHALVVSGLHVGFIVIVIRLLMYHIPVKKKIKNIVALIVVALFMGIVGFSPSVIRAGVLVISMLAGRNLILEIDNYTVLGIIILISLAINPYSALNPSLLLSYFAYFGVVKARDICYRNKYSKMVSALVVSTFAVLFTSPVMAVLDMEITLLSPIFNLALSLVVVVICTLSFFLPLIYYIPFIGIFICSILAHVNDILITIFLNIAKFGRDNLSFAMVDLGNEQSVFVLFVSVAIIFMLVVQMENSGLRKILIFTVPVLSLLCYNYLNRDIIDLKVFDGSSQPNYIISYKDKDYLIVSENITESTFEKILKNEKYDSFDEIIICADKTADTEMYGKYTGKITDITKSVCYNNELLSVASDIKSRNSCFVVNISGFRTGFNHNKADLSEYELDTYFFGSDRPEAVEAKKYFYFYPVIKANMEMVADKNAKELYDTITIKINRKTGKYIIVKDVKNFGGQLQNNR